MRLQSASDPALFSVSIPLIPLVSLQALMCIGHPFSGGAEVSMVYFLLLLLLLFSFHYLMTRSYTILINNIIYLDYLSTAFSFFLFFPLPCFHYLMVRSDIIQISNCKLDYTTKKNIASVSNIYVTKKIS